MRMRAYIILSQFLQEPIAQEKADTDKRTDLQTEHRDQIKSHRIY